MRILNTTSLLGLLLFSVSCTWADEQRQCTNPVAAVSIEGKSASLSIDGQQINMHPLSEMNGQLLFHETRPGSDDERIETVRLFRFDPDSGILVYFQEIDGESLVLETVCKAP